jgi:tetratricopeptide (TPR) repeat protein
MRFRTQNVPREMHNQKSMMNPLVKIIVAICLVAFFAMQMIGLKPEFERARRKAINEVSPNAFNDLAAAALGKSTLNQERLSAYLRYAQALTRLDPQRADAWGLAGFCYFEQGEQERSVESYLKASALVPQFFGFHYNLAFIYFKMNKYDASASEVQKALLCDPQESLIYILSSSKIYALMLIAKANNYGISAEEQIKGAYQKMYQLMAAIQYRSKMGTPYPDEELLTLEGY